MNRTAVYVVVSGPPGSGKSTLARGLAPELGLPLLSKDRIKEALFDHVWDDLVDFALINGNHSARRPPGWLGQPVVVDERRLEELPVTVIEQDLVDDSLPITREFAHETAGQRLPSRRLVE